MSYKDALTQAMTDLASDPTRVFVGYGITTGRAMGTLKDVPKEQLLETPVAESLMMGVAIGLSLSGRKPVVYFERMDFVTNAMDALVNHLAAMSRLSRGEFNPAVIIRCTIGNRGKPLFTGPVHTQDFTDAIELMVGFPVIRLDERSDAAWEYKRAASRQDDGVSTMIAEWKDFM